VWVCMWWCVVVSHFFEGIVEREDILKVWSREVDGGVMGGAWREGAGDEVERVVWCACGGEGLLVYE
jgi:hypothetical protein